MRRWNGWGDPPNLEWDDERWEAEARAYQTLWNRAYRPFGDRNI
jgi:hypothetical protein